LGQLNLNWVQQITFGCAHTIFGGTKNNISNISTLSVGYFIGDALEARHRVLVRREAGGRRVGVVVVVVVVAVAVVAHG